MSRSGYGWVDVTAGGKTVGFIVKPSNPGGKWHCYVDKPNGQSRHVGWAEDDRLAREKVRAAAARG